MKTKIIGILNYTPNSFSDGGEHFTLKDAVAKMEELLEFGSDIVDIGATSTSYGNQLISAEEEWDRLSLLLKELGPKYGAKISLDTYNALNAQKAIDLGVCMINDVSGCKDPEMVDVIAANQHVKYVVMHSLVVPADRNIRATNLQEILNFGINIKKKLNLFGIQNDRIIFDPGIGFATGPDLSLQAISHLSFFNILGLPIYIGHSRKSFLESLTVHKPKDRDIETLAASIYMIMQNVDYLRVHNVDMHSRALHVWDALRNHGHSGAHKLV